MGLPTTDHFVISNALRGARYLLRRFCDIADEKKWMIVHNIETTPRTRSLLADNGMPDSAKAVILMYNSMFGMPLPLDKFQIPPGFAFTTNRRYRREASAVVFHIPTLHSFGRLPRYRPDQLLIGWYMESEVHCSSLQNSRFMKQFDLTMSFRRDADVWAPYEFPDFRHMGLTPKPKSPKRVISMFFSNKKERSGRNRYAQELMEQMDVHSYGHFSRNRRLPNDSGRASKLQLLTDYKFNLAFENAIEKDYVTEKFFDPLARGCVPVYLGAPNIDDFAPGDHSFIHAADFSGPKELAEYLLALNEDEKAYSAYHDWRRRPLRPQYRRFIEIQRVHPFSRLCQVVQQQIRLGGEASK